MKRNGLQNTSDIIICQREYSYNPYWDSTFNKQEIVDIINHDVLKGRIVLPSGYDINEDMLGMMDRPMFTTSQDSEFLYEEGGSKGFSIDREMLEEEYGDVSPCHLEIRKWLYPHVFRTYSLCDNVKERYFVMNGNSFRDWKRIKRQQDEKIKQTMILTPKMKLDGSELTIEECDVENWMIDEDKYCYVKGR